MILPSPMWLTSRLHLATLCNDRGLLNRAVEVGTHKGHFASRFLQDWNGRRLYCVDPYRWGLEKDGQNFGTRHQRDTDYAEAVQVVRRAMKKGQSYEFVRLYSAEAVKRFQDHSIDFAYIDADHSYEAVLEDLKLWWPKIIPGGILAGHDVVCFGERNIPVNWGHNVQPAILEFLRGLPCEVHCYIIIEQKDLSLIGGSWSYYFEKPTTL